MIFEWGEKMLVLLKCELIGNGESEVWILNMNWAIMWRVMIDLWNVMNCKLWVDIVMKL